MKSLKEILSKKKFDLDYKSNIKDAMAIMYENKNGCAILTKNKKPIAIITESDLINALKQNINLTDKAYSISTKTLVTANGSRPIEFAFDLLSQNNIRRIVLVDRDDIYIGVVLQEDLFEYLEEDVYKVDLKISDIMKTNQNIITVDINDTIKNTLSLMQKYQIGSVLVANKGEYLGIITEKDILKLTYFEIDLEESVEKHMSSPLISVSKEILVTQIIELMKLRSIRRAVIADNDGSVIGMLTNRDILKHIKGNYTRILQNKIRHAQEIMDFLPEPIIEVYYSNDEEIIYWMNTKAKKVFGSSLINKSILKLLSSDTWFSIKNFMKKSKQLKNKVIKINKRSYKVSGTISKNINTNYIKMIFKDVTIYEKEKSKLQNIVSDEIKKRMDSEYILMQQAKLATMGEMIGHIAHQWRQPLSQLGGIFMNLESAYEFGELDAKYLEQKVSNGNDLLKYMSTTIEDFKNFFEPNREKEVFSIEEYINSAINIIRASLTYHHISLTFNQIGTFVKIKGYPSEFSQVILNILANAQDVLMEKEIENPFINISVRETSTKYFIDIEDNGGGIDMDIIDKVFDIYFTTKSKKEGTGLGLYISKLIIEAKLGGSIYVCNSQDGAIFTIELNKL